MPTKKKAAVRNKSLPIVSDKLITSVAEGILAYRIFLSKCAVSTALSEYTFYEPIQRIIGVKKGLNVCCEYPVKKIKKQKGDNQRIDFVIGDYNGKNNGFNILTAIEIKAYISKKNKLNIKSIISDKNKLNRFKTGAKFKNISTWVFVLHTSNDKISNKLQEIDGYFKTVSMKCVNTTYKLDLIRVA